MVRIRTPKNKVVTLPKEARFIEICDSTGNIAAVVFINDNEEVIVAKDTDADFKRYIEIYNIKQTKVVK